MDTESVFGFFFLKILFTYLVRGKGREKERERNITCERYVDWVPLARHQLEAWPPTQACALTGNQTGDLLVHRRVLNPLSHTSQGQRAF